MVMIMTIIMKMIIITKVCDPVLILANDDNDNNNNNDNNNEGL